MSTMETVKKGVKYVQRYNKNTRTTSGVSIVTLNKYILAGLIHKITGNITCSQSTIMKLNHGHCYGVGKFEFEQIGATWDFCYSFNFKLNKVSKNN